MTAVQQVSDLDPAVWPAGARRGADGVVAIGGVDVRDLAAEFGTPAYVLDEDDFRARCRAWRGAFDGADVYYAGKSFLCSAIARWVAEEGLGLDVCTGGELAVAQQRLTELEEKQKTAEADALADAAAQVVIADAKKETAAAKQKEKEAIEAAKKPRR